MRKGVTILLGLMVATLMLTSLLSAVNSEIIIAKNAALVVTSQPVIASDTTIQELEPDKYDAMIDSFHADSTPVIPEPDQISVHPEESAAEATAAVTSTDSTLEGNDTTQAVESDKTVVAEALPGQGKPAPLYASAEIRNDNVIEPGPSGTAESITIFTVQAGSYNNRFNAEDKYRSIIHDMNAADLDNLRIEKVGNYYAVRLGRFDHYVTAMKFLDAMNSKLASAIVLKAYIKDERIVALHNNALLAGK